MALTRFWEPKRLEESQWIRIEIGSIGLRLKARGNECMVYVGSIDTGNHLDDSRTESLEDKHVNRWVLKEKPATVCLLPCMPDRPLVVRPSAHVKIAVGASADLFLGLPIWVSLSLDKDGNEVLTSEPTDKLTNTWFGTTSDGELCYGLQTKARRSPNDFEMKTNRCLCPITIQNKSKEVIEFQRMILRVAHLDIYAGLERLWTNPVRFVFGDEGKAGTVEYLKKKPEFEPVGELLRPAREPVKKGFLKWGLEHWKSFVQD